MLSGAMDDKFELLFSETHALREEMRAGFVDVRTEIARAREELRADIGALGSALAADTAGVRRDLGLPTSGHVHRRRVRPWPARATGRRAVLALD